MKNSLCKYDSKKWIIPRKISLLFQNMKRNFYFYVMIKKKYCKILTKTNKKMIYYKNKLKIYK